MTTPHSFEPEPPGTPPEDDAAATRIAGHSPTARGRVLAQIRACGEHGATDAEVQAALGMLPQSEPPRRRELVRLGFIRDLRRRRATPSGRPAAVWVAVDAAGGETP